MLCLSNTASAVTPWNWSENGLQVCGLGGAFSKMANEADWFKIYPAKYLSIAGRIPDGTQRAEFLYIAMHCLNQGSLPDDDDELSFITAIAIDRIKNLRPYLNRLCSAKDGKLIVCLAEETIAERMEFSAKKAQAGKKGGEQRQAPLSTAKQKEAQLDDAQANPSQTNKQTDRQEVVVKKEGKNDDGQLVKNPLSLDDAVAQAMGMSRLPEGKPGEKLRSIAEDFRAAGILPAEVTAFADDWVRRKVQSGKPNVVLIPDYLAADCPGWVKLDRAKKNGATADAKKHVTVQAPDDYAAFYKQGVANG